MEDVSPDMNISVQFLGGRGSLEKTAGFQWLLDSLHQLNGTLLGSLEACLKSWQQGKKEEKREKRRDSDITEHLGTEENGLQVIKNSLHTVEIPPLCPTKGPQLWYGKGWKSLWSRITSMGPPTISFSADITQVNWKANQWNFLGNRELGEKEWLLTMDSVMLATPSLKGAVEMPKVTPFSKSR